MPAVSGATKCLGAAHHDEQTTRKQFNMAASWTTSSTTLLLRLLPLAPSRQATSVKENQAARLCPVRAVRLCRGYKHHNMAKGNTCQKILSTSVDRMATDL
eukprot:TRINITY_DN24073_c0_g1_i1.p2 TRINITY_DN24073_c0_g1~~TRINITY_DN24073_c0_g1_i1.p2  ORF type:complete len:101 (+),score=1.50 TRINITY_DN24073_c0_g1_i1:46-348(+)